MTGRPGKTATAVALGAVAVATVIVFSPLVRFFFAQDDFILMFNASHHALDSFTSFFTSQPGQFRPLSKVAYFALMGDVFGLNATAYHVVSLLVHLLNVGLVFALMRALGRRWGTAVVVTTLFALSNGFFHVIAWISCIQQLLGLSFMLGAVLVGIRALDTVTVRDRAFCVALYALALMCVEQAFPVPLVLAGLLIMRRGDMDKESFERRINSLAPAFWLLTLYVVFVTVWKGLPQTGPYAFSYGADVIRNTVIYTGWSCQFAAVMPFYIDAADPALTFSHVFLAGLVLYLALRKRGMALALGLGWFALAILPALFLHKHTYYLHTYIPAVGVLLLISAALEELPGRARLGRAALVVFIVLATVAAGLASRENRTARIVEEAPLLKSFVLRRAVIAKNVFDGVTARETAPDEVDELVMAYQWPGDEFGHNNVRTALGGDKGLRILYDNPELRVRFTTVEDSVAAQPALGRRVFFHDAMGQCMTPEEFARRFGRER